MWESMTGVWERMLIPGKDVEFGGKEKINSLLLEDIERDLEGTSDVREIGEDVDDDACAREAGIRYPTLQAMVNRKHLHLRQTSFRR